MSQPLVSVILPVYNGERFLKEAIESILNQSFSNFELFIINDGSIDSSLAIINSFQDDRIIVINQQNRGLAAALNVGISKSSGKYIARMDADDISMYNRFKTQVDYLEKNTDISVLSGAVDYIDQNGKTLGRSFPVTYERIMNDMLFLVGCIVNHPAVMIRKEDLDMIGEYSELIGERFEDYQLWIRFINKGFKIKNLSEILLQYRMLETSISSQYYLPPLGRKYLMKMVIEGGITQEQINKIKQYYVTEIDKIGLKNRQLNYDNIQNFFFCKIRLISKPLALQIISGWVNIYWTLKVLYLRRF